jgi:hypothetical protein
VVLWLDSIQANADTLEYEEALDHLELRGNARVDAPEYDLEGETIELSTPIAGEREVRASRAAELTGEDFLLQAERIFLFARDDRLQRLVALAVPPGPEAGAPPPDPAAERAAAGLQGIESRGRAGRVPTAVAAVPAEGRPRAFADEFEITADSLEILVPGEQLERLFAAGRARSVSTDRDSLTVAGLPDVAQTDWLEGDTIVVTFAPPVPLDPQAAAVAPSPDAPAAPDTLAAPDAGVLPTPDTVTTGAAARAADKAAPDAGGSGTRIERIVAIASARSLYRLPPSDPSARPGVDAPAIHYVVGDRITIIMQDGEVDRMEVEGGTTGIHLEPLRPGSGP